MKSVHDTVNRLTKVGDEGVVTVTVDRKRGVIIDGEYVQPETGISTTIEFRRVGGDGRTPHSALNEPHLTCSKLSAQISPDERFQTVPSRKNFVWS